ncbi:MAG: hypothetical protein HC835_03825 [Oscillatoriales cyanobacterium RM2_1_1]|nr:hypothetical protein [Oscillatoriales cyanobacterium SM2_3_0]NJO44814.1 hypothetical protein [Oscillatoriales cyanobacterium RM2_1_1]
MKNRIGIWRVACLIYLLILLTIMLIADFGKLPIELLSKVPNYDIILHFILYGIASILSYRALNCQMMMILGWPLPLGPFLFSLITIAEELLQRILPHRIFSLIDLSASLLGIVLFYSVGRVYFPPKTARE